MKRKKFFGKTGKRIRHNIRIRKNLRCVFLSLLVFIILGIIIFVLKKSEDKEHTIRLVLPAEEQDIAKASTKRIVPTFANIMEIASNFDDVLRYVYSVDETAYVEEKDLPIDEFLQYDFKTELKGDEPKILIFHTHSQEAFANSKKGEVDDTIVGVGRRLAEILTEEYGISVVHDVGNYDVLDGKEVRGGSYEKMEPAAKELLKKYPSIEIAIDLHRDALGNNKKLVTTIDGKQTAKIMYFNGVSKENKNGKPNVLSQLYNPYQKENLAFSLQMFLLTNEMYPNFARRNFIKPYRYSLHLLPKSLLIEIGSNTNTVQEAKNAMYPLAEVLVRLIK